MRFLALSYIILLALPCFAKQESILIVNSYHQGFEWVDDYTRAIGDVLGDKYKIQSFDMDTKRISKTRFKQAADKAVAVFEKLKPVIVILADDHALRFVGPKLINRDVKIVFLGINNNPRNYFSTSDMQKLYGVLEQPLLVRSIVLLQEIFSGQKKNAVFQYDTCDSSEYVVRGAFGKSNSLVAQNITTELSKVKTYKDWKQAVKSSKRNGYDVLFAGFYHCIFDNKLKHVNHDKVIKWSAENTSIPIFAFWDFAIGKGKAIGGYVISGYEMGKQAADIATDILDGVPRVGRDRIVSLKKGSFLFSRSELQKWKIELPTHIKKQAKFIK